MGRLGKDFKNKVVLHPLSSLSDSNDMFSLPIIEKQLGELLIFNLKNLYFVFPLITIAGQNARFVPRVLTFEGRLRSIKSFLFG